MRGFAAVVIALVAACDQSGVQIIVYIPADYGDGPDADGEVKLPDEVRLFVGLGEEHMVRLGPEGFAVNEARSGTYWLRDPNNHPDVDRATISVDTPARFSFLRDGAVDELGIVVAVGYTAGEPTSSATLFHAKLGTGTVLQYRIGLNGAADPRDKAMRSRVNQLEVWGANECVHVDNRRSDIDDAGHRVAFIVDSEEDRDCDGLVEDDPVECDADVHLGVGPSKEPSCLFDHVESESICTVGAARCRDGVGDDGTCNRTRFCAPDHLCSTCRSGGAPWTCAQNFQARTGNALSYGITCTFPAMQLSSASTLCEPPASVTLVPPMGATCQGVAVKGIGDPGFGDTFSLAGAGNTGEIKVAAQGCTLTLDPTGRVGGTVQLQHFGALMLVSLNQQRGIGVPIHVEVDSSTGPTPCADTPTCVWGAGSGSGNPDACVLAP